MVEPVFPGEEPAEDIAGEVSSRVVERVRRGYGLKDRFGGCEELCLVDRRLASGRGWRGTDAALSVRSERRSGDPVTIIRGRDRSGRLELEGSTDGCVVAGGV